MLAWALWLANSLLNWLRWGWGCFSADGLWRKSPQRAFAKWRRSEEEIGKKGADKEADKKEEPKGQGQDPWIS